VAKSRISVVQYLNSAPLAWGITEGRQKDAFEPAFSTPAECADQLSRGVVDIGLIPSIEYQRIKGSRIVPGPVIASTHRVRSVLLISVKPLWKVRTVAADNSSRTSVALARVIFSEFYHIMPDFRPAEPDLPAMLAQSDAALLIGDRALKFSEENENPNIDTHNTMLRLGPEPLQVYYHAERWRVLTGIPFLFAICAVREGLSEGSEAPALKHSLDLVV
jgi:chorismate dehydratase